MSALDRKLFRDLWLMRGQALAICAVMTCGIAVFVMALSLYWSLESAQQGYYERYRFAHVFAHVKRAPRTLLERLTEVPGVARIEARIVEDVMLDLPSMPEPIVGRLISLPESGEPAMNGVYLRRGRLLAPGSANEVLLSETFADAHGLNPGDRLIAVLNGRRQRLRVVGIALSPEYVYQVRPGDVLPDDLRFGILWMNEDDLAAAFDLRGAFNDLSLRLMPGASAEEVMRRVDHLTADYGGLGAYPRADQISHAFLESKLRQIRSEAIVAPILFLSVAAFLLNIVMTRLIGTQREQIATLKAFGYGRIEIGWHYLKMVLVLVVAGSVAGIVLGAWMGSAVTVMFTRYFRFPSLPYALDPPVIGSALLLCSGAAIGGTLTAVWRAMRLPPAEAMRPEPPATFRPTLVERLGLRRFVSPGDRMILRQMERQPIKTLLSMLGIALSVAILVLGDFMGGAVQYVMDTYFHVAQRQDVSVTFLEPRSRRAIHDLGHLPGVRRCEPFRVVSVRLRFGPRSRRLAIQGLDRHGELYQLIDIYRHRVELPADGLVLSRKLAELLDARVGDTVIIEVLEGVRPVREMVVVDLVDDFAGTNAYMNRDALNRLMREGPLVSGAYLAVDAPRLDELYTKLKHAPQIGGVVIKEAALKSFQDTIAENLIRLKVINVLFACVIAFGVVYNSVRIALAERARELATLRVIGFTRAEVSRLLLGELAVLTVLAIPVGLLMGRAFSALASSFNDTELFRIPLYIAPSTYGFATLVTVIAAVVSGLIVRRQIDRLDLVSVLKTKE